MGPCARWGSSNGAGKGHCCDSHTISAAYFGDPAFAFEAMRKLADTGGSRMAFVWMPQLASMRRLPEFKAYLREIRMVAYWQEFGWPPFCKQVGALDFECN